MLQLNAEPGAYRVVDASELFDLTSRGWRLVAVLDQHGVKEIEEPMPPELQPKDVINNNSVRCSNCYTSYHDGVRRWKKPHLVATQRFLVHHVKDDLLAELHTEIAKLSNASTWHEQATKTAEKAHEETRKKLTELEAEQKKLFENNLANNARAEQEAALRRKLEYDLASVRKAVGDLRMNEILAGKAS